MPESLVYLLYCHYLLDYSLSSLLSTLVDLICISITNDAGHVSMGLLAICIALIKHLFNYLSITINLFYKSITFLQKLQMVQKLSAYPTVFHIIPI